MLKNASVKLITDYKSAMNYLESVNQLGSVLGLDSIKELLKRLGNPQDKLSFVHVAGTNGKGSAAAYISNILAQANCRVGRYSSPAVFEYWERIQITDQTSTQMISKESVASHLGRIKEVVDSMCENGFGHPTIFEIETALAFLEFEEQVCDIVVLEVGLGGRLDATNVVSNTICAVITAISMDHTEFLGDSLEKIAYEKAGIIKKGCQVVSYEQDGKVRQVIEKAAREHQVEVIYTDFQKIRNVEHSIEGITFDYGKYLGLKTKLLGEHQVYNVALAVEAAKVLQTALFLPPITSEMIYSGIHKTKWPGRLELLERDPVVLIDGAHNEAAALSLRKSIELYFPKKKIFYIMGVFADKDYESILAHTADLAYKIFTITPDNQRALPSYELAQIAEKYCDQVIDANTIGEAINRCKREAKEEDIIIAFGSLSYLGEMTSLLNKKIHSVEPIVAVME